MLKSLCNINKYDCRLLQLEILHCMFRLKALIILFSSTLYSFAQQPFVGIEAGAGINLPQTSVTGLPSPAAYASLSIAPLKLGHFAISYNIGSLFGSGKINSDIETSNANLGLNKFQYQTYYTLTSLEGYLNLHHIFKHRKVPHRIIPYLLAGFGQMNATSEAENQSNGNTKRYKQKYFVSTYGLMFKVKINHRFDWTLKTAINLTETKYLDGIYYDKKYDAMLNIYAGLVYYPWASKKRHYIAWQPYKKICPKSLAF